MHNLTHETALLVIQQLNLLEGNLPSVTDAQLARGVCLNVAAQQWLAARGGASAHWALVDLLAQSIADAATEGADLAAPMRAIADARVSAGRLSDDAANTLRVHYQERAARTPREASRERAAWMVAHLAAVLADNQGARDFNQALASASFDLAVLNEVCDALTR